MMSRLFLGGRPRGGSTRLLGWRGRGGINRGVMWGRGFWGVRVCSGCCAFWSCRDVVVFLGGRKIVLRWSA